MQLFFLTKKPVSEKPASETRPHSLTLGNYQYLVFIFKGIPYDGEKADVWSMGVVLYTMVTGRMPFDDSDTKVLLQHIKRGVTFQKSKQQISEDCKDLIRSMLILDFRARITIEDIECHSWLTGKLRNSNESPERNCFSTSTCGNTSQKQFSVTIRLS